MDSELRRPHNLSRSYGIETSKTNAEEKGRLAFELIKCSHKTYSMQKRFFPRSTWSAASVTAAAALNIMTEMWADVGRWGKVWLTRS